MDKKGQIGGQGIFIGVVIMIILLVVLLAYGAISYSTNFFLGEINTGVQANIDDNNTKEQVQHMTDSFPGMQETVFGLIMFFVWAFAMFSAWISDSNPLVFVIMIVIVIVLAVLAGMLSNFWDDMDNADSFVNYDDSFPFMNFVLDNYVLVFGVMLFSMLFVSFAKGRFT